MLSLVLLVFIFTVSKWSGVAAVGPPVVNLGYSIYEGTNLGNGQSQFLGLRFATPPLGNLRWKKPLPPQSTKGIQQATALPPACFGVDQGVTTSLSEDCLFINVWSPSDATPGSRLPTLFWIQGGGYETNADPNVSLPSGINFGYSS